MFLYINVRKFIVGRGPHIFTEQGPIGFKSGPDMIEYDGNDRMVQNGIRFQ